MSLVTNDVHSSHSVNLIRQNNLFYKLQLKKLLKIKMLVPINTILPSYIFHCFFNYMLCYLATSERKKGLSSQRLYLLDNKRIQILNILYTQKSKGSPQKILELHCFLHSLRFTWPDSLSCTFEITSHSS